MHQYIQLSRSSDAVDTETFLILCYRCGIWILNDSTQKRKYLKPRTPKVSRLIPKAQIPKLEEKLKGRHADDFFLHLIHGFKARNFFRASFRYYVMDLFFFSLYESGLLRYSNAMHIRLEQGERGVRGVSERLSPQKIRNFNDQISSSNHK